MQENAGMTACFRCHSCIVNNFAIALRSAGSLPPGDSPAAGALHERYSIKKGCTPKDAASSFIKSQVEYQACSTLPARRHFVQTFIFLEPLLVLTVTL